MCFPHEVLPTGPGDSRGWVGVQWINSHDNYKLSLVDAERKLDMDLIQSNSDLLGKGSLVIQISPFPALLQDALSKGSWKLELPIQSSSPDCCFRENNML